MRMGDPGARVAVDAIPTGALPLDLALGIGGVPRGRIIEIFGPESSGKTTLVYHILAEAQKLGGVCAFIDAEHAMDPLYAQQIGVNIDELLVSQPDYGEQALEIVDMLIRSGAVDVIAIDSVAALTPRAELEGQMGDQTVGVQARMMSQAMRKITGGLNRTQTLCVFTNQIREKVGVMFGSPETQPGGRALKFYSSQRLDIRRIETLKDGTEAVGNRVRVKVVKNKVAAPFKQAEFDIEFGKGISTSGCLIDYGIEHNIITKSGSFFSYGEERLGQGRGNAKAFLDEHPDVAKEVEAKIYAALGINRDLVKTIERRGAGAPGGGRGRRGTGSLTSRDPAERSRRRACSGAGIEHAQRRTRPSAGDGLDQALATAYRYLNRRERTEAEMRAQLARAGADPRGRGAGDRRRSPSRDTWTTHGSPACSSRTSASSRSGGATGSGRRCSRVACDSDLVEEALTERRHGGSEIERAVALLRRRFPSPAGDRRERDRALGVLLRKGYDADLALEAIAAHTGSRRQSTRSWSDGRRRTAAIPRNRDGETTARPARSAARHCRESGAALRRAPAAAGTTILSANEWPAGHQRTPANYVYLGFRTKC